MNDQRLADVNLDISVVIGSTEMPIHQLLRMGRGAVIELDATTEDYV
ncbi:MAG: FliM/FliN family flagellar motor switch protein, partial [Alphaproteobacteria bacterium]|nr:FliM/FliN family flagellar motor switch protein [Alphaproteobacteria bacterium]